MRIVHITAGAGGRLCGSCLHDNALVQSLVRRGCDAVLLPAYVPTTTDTLNVSESRVVMGGINIWLQEKIPFFRYTPWFIDRLLDSPRLLLWLSSHTGNMEAADLGPLTESSLLGEHGHQKKEIQKLCFLLTNEIQPDVVHLSNALLLGMAHPIRKTTNVPIVCSLSGEDIFIEKIPEPWYSRIRELLRKQARSADRFVAMNMFFADFMADYLAVPRKLIEVIPHGIDPNVFPQTPPDICKSIQEKKALGKPVVIGALARACPEKGLHLLIEALPMVRKKINADIHAAGAVIESEKEYIDTCLQTACTEGVADHFTWLGQLDHAAKHSFFRSIDLFVMPTVFPEAKGIPVIEAMASGVPVVAPNHGAFPEMLHDEHNGRLHKPGDVHDLARVLIETLECTKRSRELGINGHAFVQQRHLADQMAEQHELLYDRVISTHI